MTNSRCQVAIIGSGPSGLATAVGLRRLGVRDVVVIDRESAAGGIPRHCGHSPFGMREFGRVLSGPTYAIRMTELSTRLGTRLKLNTTVVNLEPAGKLMLSTGDGIETLEADRVVICTGNRETPRSAQLVSGTRPMGVVTTGALQSMVYLKHRRPFRKPLIIGSELIAFSALMTCRHVGIKPLAMIENRSRVTAWRWSALMPRLLGCELLLNSSLQRINGNQQVESVEVRNHQGELRSIDCDGIIFSGNFVAETSLIRSSHLEFDSRGGLPMVDQFGRCSDPNYFACGNLLHPVDTAGWCWAEGLRTAAQVNASLQGKLPDSDCYVDIECSSLAIKYFSPQRVSLSRRTVDSRHPGFQIRFNENGRGLLSLSDDHAILSSRKFHALRERRILMPLPNSDQLSAGHSLTLEFLPQ